MTENTARKQRGAPFKPGQSGNPTGKPKGARHKTTLAIEELLDGEAEGLTRKAIELAMAGDMQALRLCMDRIAPARKDRTVSFDMPAIETLDDLPSATRTLMVAVASGELTPSEARELGALVDTHMRAIQVAEFANRLNLLEAKSQ